MRDLELDILETEVDRLTERLRLADKVCEVVEAGIGNNAQYLLKVLHEWRTGRDSNGLPPVRPF